MRVGDASALDQMPELGLRKINAPTVTKSLGSFSTALATSIKTAFKVCTQCCDSKNTQNVESGETKCAMERARVRSLATQAQNMYKATLFDTEGYEEYSAACDAANPERTPAVPKPRRQLEEMEEKPSNYGMFAIILSCLLSNIVLEV